MTAEAVLQISGEPAKTTHDDSGVEWSYSLDATHPLLKVRRLTGYFLRLRFRTERLAEISFGFDYP